MEPTTGRTTALRGAALTYVEDPFVVGVDRAMRYESDAIVAMADGKFTHFGPAAAVADKLPKGTSVRNVGKDSLMLAGFIDCHVHYPQRRSSAPTANS